jgi:hypothetical protein
LFSPHFSSQFLKDCLIDGARKTSFASTKENKQ